jgi:hypothetical protein
MGWRTRLAKKNFNKAKSYAKKAYKYGKSAKNVTKEVLNALPTVNENAFYDDPHPKAKKRRTKSYLDQLM